MAQDYIILVHSLLMITTPFVLFSFYYTPFELTYALRLSKATVIFVQPKFLHLIQSVAQDIGFPNSRIYILDGEVDGRWSLGQMVAAVKKNFTSRLTARPAGKDTLAYLIFSSGTSGLPKSL